MAAENPGTYGIEVEKTFATMTGGSHEVGNPYFLALKELKNARGEEAEVKYLGDRSVGVSTPHGEESLDNSFGLGESATGPISEAQGGLNVLSDIVNTELRDVAVALGNEGATVVNMANHPLVEVTDENYARAVVPKPIYPYLRGVRGWNHAAGINGKSQNSPSVGVTAETAVGAVNNMIGLGGALIALYANSPFEQGKVTSVQENRLALWPDMFGNAKINGDRRLHLPPEKPFDNMRDYFQWMFGPGTSMLFVAHGAKSGASEKAADKMVMIDGAPSLLDFVEQKSWMGKVFGSDERVRVESEMAHVAMHQFFQFSGARIRYGLNDEDFPVAEFTEAMHGTGDEVDRLFAKKGSYFYIEGRDPGANFPDRELCDNADGDVAKSVVISPTAIQAGIIRNASEARKLVEDYGWDNLMGLRNEAVTHGLRAEYNGRSVTELCRDLMGVAAAGLRSDEQWMLAYPEYVLSSNANGADRALASFERAKGTTVVERIKKVTRDRSLVLPG